MIWINAIRVILVKLYKFTEIWNSEHTKAGLGVINNLRLATFITNSLYSLGPQNFLWISSFLLAKQSQLAIQVLFTAAKHSPAAVQLISFMIEHIRCQQTLQRSKQLILYLLDFHNFQKSKSVLNKSWWQTVFIFLFTASFCKADSRSTQNGKKDM